MCLDTETQLLLLHPGSGSQGYSAFLCCPLQVQEGGRVVNLSHPREKKGEILYPEHPWVSQPSWVPSGIPGSITWMSLAPENTTLGSRAGIGVVEETQGGLVGTSGHLAPYLSAQIMELSGLNTLGQGFIDIAYSTVGLHAETRPWARSKSWRAASLLGAHLLPTSPQPGDPETCRSTEGMKPTALGYQNTAQSPELCSRCKTRNIKILSDAEAHEDLVYRRMESALPLQGIPGVLF